MPFDADMASPTGTSRGGAAVGRGPRSSGSSTARRRRHLGSVTGLVWARVHPIAVLAVHRFVLTSAFRASGFAGWLFIAFVVLAVLSAIGEPIHLEGLLLAIPLWAAMAIAVAGIALAALLEGRIAREARELAVLALLPGRSAVRAPALAPEGLCMFDHVELPSTVTGESREMRLVLLELAWRNAGSRSSAGPARKPGSRVPAEIPPRLSGTCLARA